MRNISYKKINKITPFYKIDKYMNFNKERKNKKKKSRNFYKALKRKVSNWFKCKEQNKD